MRNLWRKYLLCNSSSAKGLQVRNAQLRLDFSFLNHMRLLEEEIAHLQSSETSLVKLDEETENEKHLALIECECRKLKDAREAHEAAIQHLLIFVDKVSQSGTIDVQTSCLLSDHFCCYLISSFCLFFLKFRSFCHCMHRLPTCWSGFAARFVFTEVIGGILEIPFTNLL